MEEKRLKKMEITISRIDNDKSYYEGFFFHISSFHNSWGLLNAIKAMQQSNGQILH